jgi:hypothetical protein
VRQAGTTTDNKNQCRSQTISYAIFLSMEKQTNLLKLLRVDASLKFRTNFLGMVHGEWDWAEQAPPNPIDMFNYIPP